MPETTPHVAVIGGGFTGLSAALRLLNTGCRVTLFEADDALGGLASGFDIGGQKLERFYHHWFNNDRYVVELVKEIGREGQIVERPTRTGMYYAQSFYKLSSPLDLLKFTPLSLVDRIRLGMVVFRARAVKGEIKAFVDDRVDIDRPMLARAFAGMEQHILDDGIRALAVLHDLVEIALQHLHQFAGLVALRLARLRDFHQRSQFVDHFDR